MAKPKKTTKAELQFALTFLRLAGIRNAHTKIYLILAIVAWRRDGLKFDRQLWASPYSVLRKLRKVSGGSKALKTLRQFVASSEYESQQHAVRFMTMLGLSAWDKDHFGIFDNPPRPDGSIDTSSNRLFALWNKLLAMKHNIPQPVVPPPKAPTPPKPKPRQPDDKVYLTPIPEYISPYAAFDFYEERKRKVTTLPGDLA